jgi:lipoprotein-anchoring transpeptidase ErfK/SrfK
MSSNIQGKTIRPGGLRYSYYRSGVSEQPEAKAKTPKRSHFKVIVLALILVIAAPIAYSAAQKNVSTNNAGSNTHKTNTTPAVTTPTKTTQAVTAAPNNCANNQLPQLILVSVSQRHLWACNGTTQVYDSAVVTGDEGHADTLTPVGTYHIYAMETDKTLTGSDENGSWDDFVYYWMPFLYNQYGAYGLHDATWRPANAFGNISPDSSTASNGCVELPLATAKWIYDWASVGTTVTIES